MSHRQIRLLRSRDSAKISSWSDVTHTYHSTSVGLSFKRVFLFVRFKTLSQLRAFVFNINHCSKALSVRLYTLLDAPELVFSELISIHIYWITGGGSVLDHWVPVHYL